ncbi:hypothetical protein [Acidovorax sp. LjRoot194]|uniref:hypothetical protein n=1 Tax=Acidovorax sp. LjRoot194 TaxID=3342280 RepID=UPI003ED0831A
MPVSQGSGGTGIPGAVLKAWVRMTSAGAFVAGFNVTSTARSATGSYTVTFTSAMSGTGYMVRFSPSSSAGSDAPVGKLGTASTAAVAAVYSAVFNASGTLLTDMGGVWEFYE